MTHLRLYLDSADTAAWQTWLPTGLFYGITTNPLLLDRERLHCQVEVLAQLAKQAFTLGCQEIQLQTWGSTVEQMVNIGQQLAALDSRVVVKVPITQLGTTAAKQLIAQEVPTTLTAVYAPHQVLIGAALGADYVAPYLGRLNDLGRNGREEVAMMQRMLKGVNSSTRILCASIRDIEDLTVLSAQGLDTFTFAPNIADDFFAVEATIEADRVFAQSAQTFP
jgi:transaldolase